MSPTLTAGAAIIGVGFAGFAAGILIDEVGCSVSALTVMLSLIDGPVIPVVAPALLSLVDPAGEGIVLNPMADLALGPNFRS